MSKRRELFALSQLRGGTFGAVDEQCTVNRRKLRCKSRCAKESAGDTAKQVARRRQALVTAFWIRDFKRRVGQKFARTPPSLCAGEPVI
jgi:predicted metal-dependent hydrolase